MSDYAPPFTDFTMAPHRRITHHLVSRLNKRVQLFVEWSDHPGGHWEGTSFDEDAIQHVDERLVLNYWKSRGGREKMTGLEVFHVFRIIAERVHENKHEYKVQWVGYSRQNISWEPAVRMQTISPAAIEVWQQK
ncbi:hypothetical protein F53441_3971 [Fusarium austroafricanum]|uniref:Chromo domain-containing protein n=1 Tax=Fusarium austroafricanum TaxID=2364996 RepID=A0A8H4KQA7_9HYPO|nr:hypothetical protein F53441_3971 [Fusarium austroafricanum]